MPFDQNVADTQFHDVNLECMDCPNTFVFTAGEQEFYSQRNYQQPKRCKECRAKKKTRQEQKEY